MWCLLSHAVTMVILPLLFVLPVYHQESSHNNIDWDLRVDDFTDRDMTVSWMFHNTSKMKLTLSNEIGQFIHRYCYGYDSPLHPVGAEGTYGCEPSIHNDSTRIVKIITRLQPNTKYNITVDRYNNGSYECIGSLVGTTLTADNLGYPEITTVMATKTVTRTVEKVIEKTSTAPCSITPTETVFVTSIKTCPVIPIQTITITTPAKEFCKESATVTETQTEGFTSTETVISTVPFVQPSFSSSDAVQATIQTIAITTTAKEFCTESATVTETQTEGFTSTETVISTVPFVQTSFSSSDAVQATIQTIIIMTTAKEFCKESATVTETQTEGFSSTETVISAVPFVQPSFSSSDAVQATIQTFTIMTTAKEFCKETATETQTVGFTSTETVIITVPFVQPSFSSSNAMQATIQTITITTTVQEFCKESANVTEAQTVGFTLTETVMSTVPFIQPSFSSSDAVQTTTAGKMSRACRDVIAVNATEDVDMTKAVVERIVSRLTVDKKRISAVIQKKISQEDNRPSSVAVGYIGVIFLVLPFVVVLAADLLKIYHDGFKRYRTRTR